MLTHSIMLLAASVLMTGQAETGPLPPEQRESVAEAIRRLAAPEFQVRMDATETLWKMGPSVGPLVQEAYEQTSDPEVRLRLNLILERFRFHIFADTPAAEVALINRFRFGDENDKRIAFARLGKEGSVETMMALLETEENGLLRYTFQEAVLKRLETERQTDRLLELAERWSGEYEDEKRRNSLRQFMRRQVPVLLVQGDVQRAEAILMETATGETGHRDLAAYWLLQGQLDEKLEALSARAELSLEQRVQYVYLLRANGDLDGARQVAEGLPDETGLPILRGILIEQQDWSALARRHKRMLLEDPMGYGRSLEALGYTAAFHRLAGNQNDLSVTVSQIQSMARMRSGFEWDCAEALIVNEHTEEGIEILKPRMPSRAFRMLCLQERYEEAFELAGISEPRADHDTWFRAVARLNTNDNRRFELALQVARTLYTLGERENASRYFRILGAGVQSRREQSRMASRLQQLSEEEFKLGLWELAESHAAVLLARGSHVDPIGTLFPSHKDTAQRWWTYFRNLHPLEKEIDTLARLRRLLAPQRRAEGDADAPLSREDVEQRIAQAEQQARAEATGLSGWLKALAETCRLHGLAEQARGYLEEAAETDSSVALRLGDEAARREDWQSALDWYAAARRLNPTDAPTLYVYGHALQKLGQSEEGERLMAIAGLIPLADSKERKALATGLAERGHREAAMRHWILILRTGQFRAPFNGRFRDTSVVDAIQTIGNATSDKARQAAIWEAMHLSCLESPLWIPSFRGYFHTPHIVHKARAQALLEKGDFSAAWREIERSRRAMPGNTELAEHLVPQLEEAGRADLADKLFEKCFDTLQEVCRTFPDSALHHNNLAWMSARCNRRLDEALQHVERALELVPDAPSYIDTLGEVHFRRGDIDLAIASAQRCLELEPDNRFFREQLERFQQARQEALPP